MGEKDALLKLLSGILSQKIIVHCATCNIVFLDMQWDEYLPLLRGDFKTPTKWYNDVTLHFCDHPDHKILSNTSFDFTEEFKKELEIQHCSLAELKAFTLEIRETVKELPV